MRTIQSILIFSVVASGCSSSSFTGSGEPKKAESTVPVTKNEGTGDASGDETAKSTKGDK